MSRTNKQDKGYSPQQYINQHYDLVQQFPTGKAWTLDTLPFERPQRISVRRVASRARVIETVGTYETRSLDGDVVNLWTLTEAAREILADFEDEHRQELPCGHVGFRNLPDSPYLQCQTCSGRYTPEEVKK